MIFLYSCISYLAIYLCPCTVFHDRMVGVTRNSISLLPQGGVRITTRGVFTAARGIFMATRDFLTADLELFPLRVRLHLMSALDKSMHNVIENRGNILILWFGGI